MSEPLTAEEIKELMEIFDDDYNKSEETAANSFSKDDILLGGEYEHYRNKNLYVPIDFAEIQINNEWVDAVIYIAVGNNIKYVRSVDEFMLKFELTEHCE